MPRIVAPCFYCSTLEYGWYDGTGAQVGGGLMFPSFYADEANFVHMHWSFELGSLSPGQPGSNITQEWQ